MTATDLANANDRGPRNLMLWLDDILHTPRRHPEAS